jgi:hypothetical protein
MKAIGCMVQHNISSIIQRPLAEAIFSIDHSKQVCPGFSLQGKQYR